MQESGFYSLECPRCGGEVAARLTHDRGGYDPNAHVSERLTDVELDVTCGCKLDPAEREDLEERAIALDDEEERPSPG